ncbi:Uu.00g116610.m01.CDS01 [Anthostomella pinea]|uniref:Uu.00g116610.m01.CDS01 n=1 Tax=Anthostomella pinea TaxID=933095 RepID=A0AAI8VAU9_9PEZI|nr:Uu.00g116610.m01.CDS01 [Anthostomella pinea]
MLLTSSQVSILLSSGIVALCTFALFLSGYAIQQRTLRDLRLAINPPAIPRPKPKFYSSEQLRRPKSKVRLEEGSAIDLGESELDVGGTGRGGGSAVGNGAGEEGQKQEQEEDIIFVRPTIPDDDGEPVSPPPPVTEDHHDEAASRGGGEGNSGEGEQRQRFWDGVQEDAQKPISRAERRRRIKAEIARMSQGESPVYYQRRLW